MLGKTERSAVKYMGFPLYVTCCFSLAAFNLLSLCLVFVSLISGEGNGTPLQYSCLENPMDGGAWWAAVHGTTESWTQLSDFTFTFHFHVGEGNGNPLQCSCLENPRDSGTWRAAIYGVAQSRTRLKRLSSNSMYIFIRNRCVCVCEYVCVFLTFHHAKFSKPRFYS